VLFGIVGWLDTRSILPNKINKEKLPGIYCKIYKEDMVVMEFISWFIKLKN
jgi:hypothetical protein